MEGASCGMDIMEVIVDRALWKYKVGMVWSWVERDENLLAEVNQEARKIKEQIFIQKEDYEKEEKLLRQKFL